MAKKIWQKPELIVITRSQPAESVLGDCKLQDGLGPAHVTGMCMTIAGGPACKGASQS